MSIEGKDLPAGLPPGQTGFRSITLDGEEIEFSSGFADLHVQSYREILAGRGLSVETVRPAIEILSAFRNAPIKTARDEVHLLARRYVRS